MIVIENIFHLNDSYIPVVSEIKHLGHILSNTVNGYVCIDVNYIGSCFKKYINIMMANLGSVSACILGKLLGKLYLVQCNELLYYLTAVYK